MTCFYRGSVREFLDQTVEHILAQLAVACANRGYTSQYSDQTLTWQRDIESLRKSLETCTLRSDSAEAWGLLLEFSIPRKELRIDIVLLVRDIVVLIEAKTESGAAHGRPQIEEYAMLMHYFHKGTSDHRVLPLVVSPTAVEGPPDYSPWRGVHRQMASYWVARATRTSWEKLADLLIAIDERLGEQISPEDWNDSPYFPVPGIIDAAMQLRSGLAIREIAQSEASEHEIETVRRTIQEYVTLARQERRHAICFLTGVPGSGKTLVGLSLAHSEENKSNPIHFMSGNGPLVSVIQHLFTKEGMRNGAKATTARSEAKTLIENVHVFARYHVDDNPGAPSNHAIIFDEAQRAWNQAQN